MTEHTTKSDYSYQERLEWWFYFTCEKVVPINVSEEGMSLEDKFKLIKSQTKAQHFFLNSEVWLNIKTTRKSIVKDNLHPIKPIFHLIHMFLRPRNYQYDQNLLKNLPSSIWLTVYAFLTNKRSSSLTVFSGHGMHVFMLEIFTDFYTVNTRIAYILGNSSR